MQVEKRKKGEKLETPEGTVDWSVEVLWDVLKMGAKEEEKPDVGVVEGKMGGRACSEGGGLGWGTLVA